jgi:hypothetical protein
MDPVEDAPRSDPRSRGILTRRPPLITLGVVAALLVTTLFRFHPRLTGPSMGMWIGFVIVFILPGFLFLHILFPRVSNLGIAELPAALVLNLAIWAIPAGLLQFTHSHWDQFQDIFLLVLWGEGALLVVRRWKAPRPGALTSTQSATMGLVLLALGAPVAVAVSRASRFLDDWVNLSVVQQLIRQDGFKPLFANNVRLDLRFTFQVWLFLQAFVSRWFGSDAVNLAIDFLPAVVAILSLFAVYGLAREFTGKSWAGLAAVLFQLTLYALSGLRDGWGFDFFFRSAQDKFLVGLLILPVTLLFFWRYMQRGDWADLIAYGLTILAIVAVHPLQLAQPLLVVGGVALFNLLSKKPFPRRRWAFASVWVIPALIVLLFARAKTDPSLYSTQPSPAVMSYLFLSGHRLVHLAPSLYIADPGLLAHPLILFPIGLLPLTIPYLREDRRAQFLWGSTLVPLALLFNPFTAYLIGQLITPWQIWRLTWVLPVSLIFADLATRLDFGALHTRWPSGAKFSTRRLRSTMAFAVVVAIGALILGEVQVGNSIAAISQSQRPEQQVESLMRALPELMPKPSVILVPTALLPFPGAYWGFALLPSPNAYWAADPVRSEIDQFYSGEQYSPQAVGFLNKRRVEFLVLEKQSPMDDQIRARPQYFAERYSNPSYVLYQVLKKPIPAENTPGTQ